MFLKEILSKVSTISKMIRVAFSSEKNINISPVFLEINKPIFNEVKTRTIPKIIWMYWDSEKLPILVKACYERAKKLCPDYKVVILNSKNVGGLVNLPKTNVELPKAIIADFIRLSLLKEHGGVWIDASVFLNENLEWFVSTPSDNDAFLFYSDECTLNFEHPISENWFIAAPKGSEFITEWLREFELCIRSFNPFEFYSDIKNDKEIIQNVSKPDYLLCYLSAIVVLRKASYNILYVSSASVGHYLNYKYDYNSYLLLIDLLFKNKKRVNSTKLIKLTSGSRRVFEVFIERGFYSKKSLLGEWISKL